MCGIVAIYGDNSRRWAAHMGPMMDKLYHRGPNDEGTYWGENVLLGQKRLSIVDVDGGKQPILSEDGKTCIIANGEIYNHLDLRSKLIHHEFRTNSDSEAVLHLFEDKGEEALSELDGMFALIIYDGQDLLVARDPLGIKPLYQGGKEGCLFFASELKSLEGVADTIIEFPAGHYYSSKSGLHRYYQVPQADHYESDIDTITATLRQKLSKAIRKRFMSDVPLGVFLSGGLDSSLISAVSMRHFDHLNSFAVGMETSPDLQYARQVADVIGTDHHEYIYTKEEIMEALPTVIYHLESYDPALVRSAIPTYFVSRLASQYVTVILTGEGSDEVFAGYHYFKDISDDDDLHEESIRIVEGLHNVNLQRVDRLTMAHSIEGRVPFLDIDFVEYATSIDPKLKQVDEYRMEKWLLRKAFQGYIPEEVLWRTKTEFADGCASSHVVAEFAEHDISDTEFERQRNDLAPIDIYSKEELYYYRIFRDFFGTKGLENAVGKWRGRFESERVN